MATDMNVGIWEPVQSGRLTELDRLQALTVAALHRGPCNLGSLPM